MNRKLFVLWIGIFLANCSSNSLSKKNQNAQYFHTEIEQTIKKYNDSTNSTIYIKTHKFNPTKLNFELIKDNLENSKHIIYIFSWRNHLPIAGTNDFESIIYDIDNNKKYFFYNYQKDYKNIILETKSPKDFEQPNFILDHYQSKKNELLKNLQNRFSSAEIGQDYLIVEVEIGKTPKILELTSFTLFDYKD